MGVSNLIGQGPLAKFGRNAALVTGEVVQDGGGTIAIRSSAVAVEVLSGSVADDVGGTGVEGIRIFGPDGDGNPIQEDIIMNGTTVVAATKTFKYIDRAFTLTSGSGKKNAGLITIRIGSVGATLATIAIGFGQTERCVFYVPAGCKLNLSKFVFNGGRVGTISGEIALVMYEEGQSIRVIESMNFHDTAPRKTEWDEEEKIIPGNTLLWIEAINMSASAFTTGSFHGKVKRYADPV